MNNLLDLFLKVDEVNSKEDALRWSINAALQRNRVYKDEENYEYREKFKASWGDLLSREAQVYRQGGSSRSDEQHCAAIARIADELSKEFGAYLIGGRLRFGTSQKAFNLYLKYLWALREIAMPPHCPIDNVVLTRLGLEGCWTKNDDCGEYMSWINAIRKRLQVAEWENETWLRRQLSDSGI